MEKKREIKNNENIDLLKYPEGPLEVIKYMGYTTADDEERMALLMSFVQTAVTN